MLMHTLSQNGLSTVPPTSIFPNLSPKLDNSMRIPGSKIDEEAAFRNRLQFSIIVRYKFRIRGGLQSLKSIMVHRLQRLHLQYSSKFADLILMDSFSARITCRAHSHCEFASASHIISE